MLNIAHDFRNYLTVLQGRCDQATSGAKPTAWCLEEIRKGLSMCNSLVDSMYVRAGAAASSLSALTTAENPFGLDLNAVAGEVGSTLLALPNGKKINVQVQLKIGLPPLPSGSAWELHNAIFQLALNAHNAIKYEHPLGAGGELKISTGDNADSIWVSVRDNGRGMSPEEVTNILREKNEPREYTGHGHGLSIVRSTAIALGCEVLCESGLGQGTTFTLLWKKLVPAPLVAAAIKDDGLEAHLPSQAGCLTSA